MKDAMDTHDFLVRAEMESIGWALLHYFGRDIKLKGPGKSARLVAKWAKAYDGLKELESVMQGIADRQGWDLGEWGDYDG